MPPRAADDSQPCGRRHQRCVSVVEVRRQDAPRASWADAKVRAGTSESVVMAPVSPPCPLPLNSVVWMSTTPVLMLNPICDLGGASQINIKRGPLYGAVYDGYALVSGLTFRVVPRLGNYPKTGQAVGSSRCPLASAHCCRRRSRAILDYALICPEVCCSGLSIGSRVPASRIGHPPSYYGRCCRAVEPRRDRVNTARRARVEAPLRRAVPPPRRHGH